MNLTYIVLAEHETDLSIKAVILQLFQNICQLEAKNIYIETANFLRKAYLPTSNILGKKWKLKI